MIEMVASKLYSPSTTLIEYEYTEEMKTFTPTVLTQADSQYIILEAFVKAIDRCELTKKPTGKTPCRAKSCNGLRS